MEILGCKSINYATIHRTCMSNICRWKGGGGRRERSITINNLFDEIQWFETLSNLDVGGGRRGLVSIAPSALAIVNIEDSDWLEPSIFNSLTHSF